MVHNAVHHAFMITYSIARDVHPDEYEEFKQYLMTYGKWYCLKAEDVWGEGKVHLHMIHIRDQAERDPDPSRKVTMYGPRRPASTVTHIVQNCPLIAASIAEAGGRHSLMANPLTSSKYIEYLNKETYCHCNNLPEDLCLMNWCFSKKNEDRVVDPIMHEDANKYRKDVENGLWWATEVPTQSSCRRFYRHHMNITKDKKAFKTDVERRTKQAGLALYNFMTEFVASESEDEEPPPKRTKTDCTTHTVCSQCKSEFWNPQGIDPCGACRMQAK